MIGKLWRGLERLMGIRTPEEDYQAGRAYCESILHGTLVTEETMDTLWAQTKTDSSFGGNGCFDRGIRDVLAAHGFEDPEGPWG